MFVTVFSVVFLAPIAAVRATEPIQALSELSYDAEGFLSRNYALYSPTCPSHIPPQVEEYSEENPQRLSLPASEDLMNLFIPTTTHYPSCSIVCLQRGVPHLLAHHIFPHHILQLDGNNGDDSSDSSSSSIGGWIRHHCDFLEMGVVNHTPLPLLVYWVHPETGERHLATEVEVGGEKHMSWIETYLGHAFELVEEGPEAKVVANITIEHDVFLSIGTSPASQGTPGFLDSLEQAVKEVLLGEWEGRKRVERTFTPLGFHKGKLPLDIWASMLAFYHNNRGNKIVENFSYDVLVNWWRAESSLITMPPLLRHYW